jgi:cytochrome c oxidase subunit 2
MLTTLTTHILPPLLAQSAYLPPQASTYAPEVDRVFNGILLVTAFFCLLIFAGMLYFAVKYRHRPGHEGGESPGHSTALELTWTIIPIIIVLVIFYYGFRGYLDMTVVPPNAYEVTVDGKMWSWGFVYPNGHVNPELHVPKDRPVRLILTSGDVIHSLYIPAFRAQKQAVPGRYNRFWIQGTEVGEYPLYCAQYCGTSHSEMLSKVVVHEPADFDAWLEVASNPEKQPDFTPAKAGAQIIQRRGCMQCHSLDGSAGTAPTFKDLFGRQEVLADGSVQVDENYIRESILYPNKRIVKGFQAVMPSYLGSLKDKEIDWIIAALKQNSQHFKGGAPTGAQPAEPGGVQPVQGAGASATQPAPRAPNEGQPK